MFDACVELRLLFATADVLYCEQPLMFGDCVDICLLFGAAKALHVENYLYLALVMNCVFYLALSICCITKSSYIWRLY